MEWMRSRRATWWQDWRICRATDSYSPSSAALRSTCGGGSGSIGTCTPTHHVSKWRRTPKSSYYLQALVISRICGAPSSTSAVDHFVKMNLKQGSKVRNNNSQA